MNNHHFLFVYGSLRSGFPSPAYAYISRYFNLVGNAKIKGLLYDLGDYPAALPTNENSFIVGELYEIKKPEEFDWAIAQLDDYEGLYVEQGETPLYKRELSDVFLKDATVTAWVYWYNRKIIDKPIIEGGDVLEYLKRKMS